MSDPQPDFPHAPRGRSESPARRFGARRRPTPGMDQRLLMRAPRACCGKAERPAPRPIKDAPEGSFHPRGGMRRPYPIRPGGPVAETCVPAGPQAPPGAMDMSFGGGA